MNLLPLALFGDVGGGELLVVFAAILLLFGGKRLPSIARTVGKTLSDLRKASQDFKDQILTADEPRPPDQADSTGSIPPTKEPPPRDFAG